jgi:hypothetical protein
MSNSLSPIPRIGSSADHDHPCRIDTLCGWQIDLRQRWAVQTLLRHVSSNADDFKNGTFHIRPTKFDMLSERGARILPPRMRNLFVNNRNSRSSFSILIGRSTSSRKRDPHGLEVPWVGHIDHCDGDILPAGRGLFPYGIPPISAVASRWRTVHSSNRFDSRLGPEGLFEAGIEIENDRVTLVSRRWQL